MTLATRTLTGRWLLADDTTPAAGTITITPNAALASSANDIIVPVRPLRAALDATGAISVTLICTDNAGVSPTGWAYTVVEQIGSARREYTITVPAGDGPLDLADVTPLEPAPALVQYVLAASVGTAGGPAGPLDSNGLIPTTQIPVGGGAVASVNGHTGAVVLAAADVGAVPADSTIVGDPPAPGAVRRRNYAITQSSPNVDETWIQGTLRAWQNEWGGWRGIAAYAWDSVFRAIARSDQTGNPFEYQNSGRTQVLWAVDPDGAVRHGNGQAAAVRMTPVYVAPAGAMLPVDLPAGLPAGTLVVQLT